MCGVATLKPSRGLTPGQPGTMNYTTWKEGRQLKGLALVNICFFVGFGVPIALAVARIASFGKTFWIDFALVATVIELILVYGTVVIQPYRVGVNDHGVLLDTWVGAIQVSWESLMPREGLVPRRFDNLTFRVGAWRTGRWVTDAQARAVYAAAETRGLHLLRP